MVFIHALFVTIDMHVSTVLDGADSIYACFLHQYVVLTRAPHTFIASLFFANMIFKVVG